MGKKLGNLIKSARAEAGLTQAQLAAKVPGASQSDIGRYERGESEPTTQMVKDIAKACGVTQKSLLDAMPKSSGKTTSSSKTTAKTSASKSSMQLTATEKRLVELYRAGDTATRKKAMQALRGETSDLDLDDVITNIGNLLGDTLFRK